MNFTYKEYESCLPFNVVVRGQAFIMLFVGNERGENIDFGENS